MVTESREPVRCPNCASADVRYSYTRTTWDSILDVLFAMDAFRCRSCRHRFHKFDPGTDDQEEETVSVAGATKSEPR